MRYVNIGIESSQFAYVDAKAEDLLPMNEAQWEAGVTCLPDFPLLKQEN
jgi:hypothetical protein